VWLMSRGAPTTAGPTQSALRKLSRQGVRNLHSLFRVYLRGDSLYQAAEATMRALVMPWRLRRVLQNPSRSPADKVALTAAKYVVLEGASMAVRWVATSCGAPATILAGAVKHDTQHADKAAFMLCPHQSRPHTALASEAAYGLATPRNILVSLVVPAASAVFVAVGYYAMVALRQNTSIETFQPDRDGNDAPLGYMGWVCVTLGGFVGDFASLHVRTELAATLKIELVGPQANIPAP
jgi:hypothetical protein